jgi:DNA-binding response OmpR family regulator
MTDKSLLKNLKILYVEDEDKLSLLTEEAIADNFYKFYTAKNGVEGFELFKKHKPDIVITDIMMPKMNGLEMAEEIKEKNPKTPIIVLSAYSDKEKLLKAIDVSITKYFIKPFDPDELLEYISNLAEKMNPIRREKLRDGFVFEYNTSSLYKNNKLVKLTKRETTFLNLLLENKNKLVIFDIIKERLWKDEENVSDERLRTFIKRLREKTSKD